MNNLTIGQLEEKYPFIISYFEENKLDTRNHKDKTFREYLDSFSQEDIENWAIDKERLELDLQVFIKQMKEFLGITEDTKVNSLTILPGYDKSGNKEGFEELVINKSEIISIVG
ncbi:MAG TPA: ABC transporter, partial [Tissierella sp.]|nr:ABC transporter [Tissierella sp.]